MFSSALVFLIVVTALPLQSYGQTPSPTTTGTPTTVSSTSGSPTATEVAASDTMTATLTPTEVVQPTATLTPTPVDSDRYFPETGFTVPAVFMKFWSAKGGLPIFGYPISEARTERNISDNKDYMVQYFERNRFEYHPEFAGTPNDVLLGLLGVETARRNGWLAP